MSFNLVESFPVLSADGASDRRRSGQHGRGEREGDDLRVDHAFHQLRFRRMKAPTLLREARAVISRWPARV